MECHPEVVPKTKARKRTANPTNWKKNIAKRQRYMPTSLPERIECTHKKGTLKCNTLTLNDIQIFHTAFYKIAKKEAQDTLILKYTKSVPTKRKRAKTNERQSKTYTTKFFIPANKQAIPVCQKVFLNYLGIKKDRVNYVVRKHFATGECPVEKRGGDHKSHKFTEQRKNIREFIQSLNCSEPHYCRGATTVRRYLPAELNISKLYIMYKESGIQPFATKSLFRKVFKTQLNIGFGSPNTDICSTGLQFIEKIKVETNAQKKNELILVVGAGSDSPGEYSDFDDEQAEREAGADDTPQDEYQIEVDEDEVNYDVCKVETVEHSFTDEDSRRFVAASGDNSPAVNMFAVVEYIARHGKELGQLDFATLKSLTKNNPHLITSPLVLPSPPTYRLRATVALEHSTSHMCEVEYDTRTDTVVGAECVCGTHVCQHTAAFLMWLANRPVGSSTKTSTDTLGGESAGPVLSKSQAGDSGRGTKPSAVGPSTSGGGGREELLPAKRPRVGPEVEIPVPVTTVIPDTAITVAPLPKDEDEPGKSKIEIIFPRKTIYTLWKNITGTTAERSKKIQTTLTTQLQDDDFLIDFTPIEQRVEHLCGLFHQMKKEVHKSEFSEIMNIRETVELDRVSKGKRSSLRDPLS